MGACGEVLQSCVSALWGLVLRLAWWCFFRFSYVPSSLYLECSGSGIP